MIYLPSSAALDALAAAHAAEAKARQVVRESKLAVAEVTPDES